MMTSKTSNFATKLKILFLVSKGSYSIYNINNHYFLEYS